jgi:hypothetical protein
MPSYEFLRAFRSNLAKCQSPVEAMLLEATLDPDSGLAPSHARGPSPLYTVAFTEETDLGGHGATLLIRSQADPLLDGDRPQIHCDFEFEWSGEYSPSLYVEVDGHQWHEKTHRQASRDRARDRRIVRFGRHLVRYTASDVMRDACLVLREITEILYSLEVAMDNTVGIILSRERVA